MARDSEATLLFLIEVFGLVPVASRASRGMGQARDETNLDFNLKSKHVPEGATDSPSSIASRASEIPSLRSRDAVDIKAAERFSQQHLMAI